MSRIRGSDTKPEREVRSLLHRLGYRFRINVKNLPGSPDIVLPRYKTTVFVHGCFWHRHKACRFAYIPKTRKSFWLAKFQSNIMRDRTVKRALARIGWKVVTVWECELRTPEKLSKKLASILRNRGLT